MNLQFSKAALHDLLRLRAFIAKNNPSAAARIADRLQRGIQGLVEKPKIGHPVESFAQDVREFIFGRYVVRYLLEKNTLNILRIWHGQEDRK